MAILLGIWRMLMDYWIAVRGLGDELGIPTVLAISTLMVTHDRRTSRSLPFSALLWLRFVSSCGKLVSSVPQNSTGQSFLA